MRLMDEVKPLSSTGSGSLKELDKKKQKKLDDTTERKVDNKNPSRNGFAMKMKVISKKLLVNI